jgi:hypothetical protein
LQLFELSDTSNYFTFLVYTQNNHNKQAAEIDKRCSKASQIIGEISTLVSGKDVFEVF